MASLVQLDKKWHNAINENRKAETMAEIKSKLPGVGKLKRKRRGTVKNAARLDAFAEQRGSTQASWENCDPVKLRAVICAITNLGGAVILGLSRDFGAHSVTLLLDDKSETLWFNGNADLDDEMLNVFGILDSMT